MTPLQVILLLLGMIWFVLVLISELGHDYDLISRDLPINHSKGLWRRIKWLSPTGVFLSIPDLWNIPPNFSVMIWVSVLMIGLWLTCFDGFYNLHYNRNFWHVPTPHKNSAVTDRLFYPMSIILRAVVKLGIVALGVIMYFK